MSSLEWHPDISITSALAIQCIESEFPELKPIETIEMIGEGWDNKVFLVNKQWVFRFPQREKSFQLIEQENRILNYLNQGFEVAIPKPHYISQYSKYPFHGYTMVKGGSAHEVGLSDKQRVDSIAPLAKFLKKLHGIRPEDLEKVGVAAQVFDRSDTHRLLKLLDARVKKIMNKKIMDMDYQCLARQIAIIEKIVLPKEESRLIHGDLYCRHLLFHQGKLSGIIDWGDTGINHPAIDLSILFSFYPASCHQSFFEYYGQVDEKTWQYARFIAMYILLTLVLYAYEKNDQGLLSEVVASWQRLSDIE